MKSRNDLKQKDSFGLAAKDYQKYRRTYDEKLYDLIFSSLKKDVSNEVSALDIGCGTGKSTEPLLKSVRDRVVVVTGVDPDQAMLREARLSAKKKKLPITYIQANAETLPFKKETFNVAITGAAFHWFGNKKTVTKIKKVLKKGGLFFVFWAQYIKTDKPVIGSEIYRKYNWRGVPKKFRGQKFVGDILSRGGFKKVRKTTISFSEEKTIPQILGLLKTNSSYILLSPEDKLRFLRDMKAVYEKALGKNGREVNKMELCVVYGSK